MSQKPSLAVLFATLSSMALVALASVTALGCGASVPEIPVVSIAPGAVTLQAGGGQQQFTAVVDNASNTAVVWKVNGHMNGDALTGTITQKGLYAAPAAVPTGGSVTVEAVSAANANATASAVVKLTPPVAITLTPATATAAAGGTVQFQATVSNAKNTGVTWAVNGTTGGDPTDGTISASGLYQAPATFPGNTQVTITATSVADTAISANATVTLTQAVAVTVTPPAATVGLKQSVAFAAAVSGSADTTVVWSVDGVTGGNATLGTISTAGVFSAPAAIPSPDTETITATSHADSTKSGSARVTIVPPVAVSISPLTVAVTLGGTQSFTATVSNATNTAVSWSVNGTAGGNATVGTITDAGVYTAPATAPGTQTITVTAASVADPTATASATVTLVVPIAVTISPTAATVNLGALEQFQASVTGGNGANTAVNWSVNGVAGGNEQLGTITASGRFTAPQVMPTPATETVTATSAADATQSASATVTLQVPPNEFSLSPKTSTLTLGKADSGTVTLQVALSAGFTNPITFAATGAPPNVAVTFAPATVTANGTVAVTVTTAPISLATNTSLNITATSKDASGNVIVQDAAIALTITGWAGQVSTLAGTPGGPGFQDGGHLNDELYPIAITSDGGQSLFFADKRGEALRQYSFSNQTVTTLIGDGPYTFTIGEGDGVAYDPNNGTVYVSDRQQQVIDAYSLGSGDQIHILAGTADSAGNVDGTGAAARFYGPEGLAISPDFKTLYVADSSNSSIRAIDIATGAVTTLATGFCMPTGLAIDDAGANLYVSQDGMGCDPDIKQVSIATGAVSVVAGSTTQGQLDGDTSVATFDDPSGLAMDPHSGPQILYIADHNEIRALVLGSTKSNVYTVAGQFASGSAEGSRTTATFYQPVGLTALTGPNGSTNLYVADSLNGLLRQITLDPSTLTSDSNIDSQVTTIAGQAPNRGRADGPGTGSSYSGTSVAQFDQPEGIITDGKVAYVADSNNGAIRKIDLSSGVVSTVAGPHLGSADGSASTASFYENAGLALDPADPNIIYIADSGNNLIRKLDLSTQQVTTVAGVRNTAAMVNGPLLTAEFNHPFGILVSQDGTKLYVAEAGNEDIRLIDLTAKTVSTLAGYYTRQGEVDGTGAAAEFSEPNGMAWSPDYKTIYVSDFEGEAIRAVDPTTGAVTTIAGMGHTCGDVDGPVATALLCDPTDLATDGRSLFWVEADTGQVRVMDLATQVVYSLAGLAGAGANKEVVMHQADGTLNENEPAGELTGLVRYNDPFGIALDPAGNFILITNKNENTIRIIH